MKNKSYLPDAIGRFATSVTAIKRFTAICILLLFFNALAWGEGFSVFPGNLNFAWNETQPVTVEVTAPAGTGWTVSVPANAADWLDIDTTSCIGDGTFTIRATSHHVGYVARQGTITVTNENETKQIVITQHRDWLNGSFSPMNLSFQAINADDGVYETSSTIAYSNWTARLLKFAGKDSSWCEIVGATNGVLDFFGTSFSVRPKDNNVGTPPKTRYAQVRVWGGSGVGFDILVSQFAVETILDVPPAIHFQPYEGGTANVYVASNVYCVVNIPLEARSWLTAYCGSNGIVGPSGTFQLTAAPNTGAERAATVDVGGGGITRHIAVTQDWSFIVEDGIRYGRLNPATPEDSSLCVAGLLGEAKYSGNIVIPNTVTHNGGAYTVRAIADTAFLNSPGLISVSIPDSVIDIMVNSTAGSAFAGCDSLASIFVAANNPIYSSKDGVLFDKLKQTLIHYPNARTNSHYAIPASVTKIGLNAFESCDSLVSVTIPTSLTNAEGGSINNNNCPNLAYVEVGWKNNPPSLPSADAPWFEGKAGSCTLIVPPNTVELYKDVAMWNAFETIKEKVSPDTIFLKAKDQLSDTVSDTVEVITRVPWNAVEKADWITVSIVSPTDSSERFAITADSNPGIKRSGEVEFTNQTPNGTNDAILVQVTQAANPTLIVSDSLFFNASGAQDSTITVTSYTDWTVEKDTSWITLGSASVPQGSATGTFTVSIANNDSIMRTGHITITNGDSTKTIVVTQYANPVFSVSTDSLFFTAEASSDSIITVTAYSEWTVEKDTSWIILNPALPPYDSIPGTFTVRTEDNDSIMREGHITITMGDSIKTIVVVQAANPYINVSADSLFFDAYDLRDTTITVTAYSEWTVVKDTSWIILNTALPSGSIPGTFTVRTADNDSIMREGHITITKGDSVRTIVVTQYANPTFIVSAPDSLFFDAYDSQDSTITVTAYSGWTVAKDTSWIVLYPASPSGSIPGTFTVGTADNDSIMREGHITITKGDSVKTIVVTQYANPYINVSADSLFFDASDSQETTITVTAYSEWTVAKDTSWILLTPASPSGSIPGTFTVKTENNDSTAREGHITITKGDSIRTIVVVQATNPCLNISADSLFFDAYGAQDTTITVTAYSGWTVVKDTSWIILNTESPSGSIPGTFTVRTEDNDSIMREGHITITKGDSVRTIVVTQYANPYINVSADSLFFDAYGAQDTTITVTAYSEWTVVKDTSWITLTPASPFGDIPGTFTVRTADNDSIMREGRITITKGDSVKTIVVTQYANPYINVSADSLFFDAYDSQETTITVTAYSEWTVAKDTSWIVLYPASPSGSIPGTFTVRTADNDSIVREGRITITKGDSVKTIVVTQYANPCLNVSADSLFFDASDSQDTTITVTAYSEWTVVKDTSWIILNTASPSGSIPGTFTVRTEDNDSTAREGRITITKGDSIKTIVVEQAANPEFSVSVDGFVVGVEGLQDTIINVKSYTHWTATVPAGVDWIKFVPESPSPSGDKPGTFTVRIEANGSIARRDTITVSSETAIKKIPVEQAANPSMDVSADILFLEYDLTDTVITVTAYSDWDITIVPDTVVWLTVNPDSGSGSGTFIVSAEPNDSTERTADIRITNGDTTIIIPVTQAVNPNINLSAYNVAFGATSNREATIEVAAHTEWIVFVSPDAAEWLTVNRGAGSGRETFIASATANDLPLQRNGTIIVTNGTTTPQIIQVTQAGIPPILSLSPDVIYFEPTVYLVDTIIVASNIGWTVSEITGEGAAWFTVNPKHGYLNDTLSITVQPNAGGSRRGMVIITGAGEHSMRRDTVHIVQEALLMDLPTQGVYFGPETNLSQLVGIRSNASWKLTVNDYWITIGASSGYRDGTFTVTVAPGYFADREGWITVVSAGKEVGSIKVVQTGPQIITTPENIYFEAEPYENALLRQTVQVTANISIVKAAVEYDDDDENEWLTVGLTADYGRHYEVIAQPNTGAGREASIVFSNSSKTKNVTLRVSQAPIQDISLSEDSLFLEADEVVPASIGVKSYTDWNVSIVGGSDWLSVYPPFGSGEESFSVMATTNEDAEVRTASIIVANNYKSDTLHITQAAHLDYSLRFEADGVHYYTPDFNNVDVEVVAPETGAYRGKVVIPSTVPYLANIYIVKAIGEEAFAGSDITAVKLPVSLDSVGTDAFKACDKLDSVEVEWTFIDYAYPKGITEAFEQVQQNEVTLIVPVGTKTYYQGAEFWRAFHIVEKGETPETPTGIAKAAESVAVRAASGRLYVDSPAAETVYVYSFTGKLLNAATKDSGRATLDIPQERLLIIRGSSGWARKLTVN
jgi:hypothetical protein